MRWLFVLLFASCINYSCNQNPINTKQPGTIAALNLPADSSAISDTLPKTEIAVKIFEGLLSPYSSAFILKTCADQSSYITIDKENLIAAAYQKTIGNMSYLNESVYFKAKGYAQLSAKGTDSLIVTDLIETKRKSYLTPCFNYEFILLGTEPFWSAEIIPNENIIALKDVSLEKSFVFPYSKAVFEGSQYSYFSRNKKGDTISIIVRKENCNDGMSDKNYQYSSQIEVNGRSMSGCAIKKGDKP